MAVGASGGRGGVWWLGVLAGLLVLALGGCRETPEDAVIAQYKRLDKAWGSDDVQEIRAVLTPESVELFEEIRQKALTASSAETKKLTPFMMADVLALRNGLTGAQLRAMPLDDVIYWLCSKDLYSPEMGEGVKIIRVRIAGDTATMQMGVSYREETAPTASFSRRGGLRLRNRSRTVVEEVPGWVHTFKRIGGHWYYDLAGDIEHTKEVYEADAADEEVSLVDYMLADEKARAGSLKRNLWDPPSD